MGAEHPRSEADFYGYVLGATIAELRGEQGINQGELANKVGVTQPTISRIERGLALPDAHQMRMLAAAFEMPVAALTDLIEDAYDRATEAARRAIEPRDTAKGNWWKAALAVIGTAGLAGLAGFAAGVALRKKEGKSDPQAVPTKE